LFGFGISVTKRFNALKCSLPILLSYDYEIPIKNDNDQLIIRKSDIKYLSHSGFIIEIVSYTSKKNNKEELMKNLVFGRINLYAKIEAELTNNPEINFFAKKKHNINS
jgi:hypothetical protein